MDKFRKLRAPLGFAALAVALLGFTLLLGEPASAGPDDPVDKDTQGLISSSLGV
jgi:hypothetical protein